MTVVTRVSFVAGDAGEWQVTSVRPVIGESLAATAALSRREGGEFFRGPCAWSIDGVRSNDRYVTRAEKDQLAAKPVELGRPASTLGALIPIRKTAAWWLLTQDERRAIFEETSHHVAIGLEYTPAIARRLYHCRDLGEPWDFLTWFEYAETDRQAFEDLVDKLRATDEWRYVEREVDLRVVRRAHGPV